MRVCVWTESRQLDTTPTYQGRISKIAVVAGVTRSKESLHLVFNNNLISKLPKILCFPVHFSFKICTQQLIIWHYVCLLDMRIVKFRQHLKASVGLAIVLAQCGPCKMVLCSWSMCSLNIPWPSVLPHTTLLPLLPLHIQFNYNSQLPRWPLWADFNVLNTYFLDRYRCSNRNTHTRWPWYTWRSKQAHKGS